MDNGAYVPMWLDGLLVSPLLCLVGEWARGGRHPVLGPLVVGLARVSNFYTAYLATIGAGVVLLVRLLPATSSTESPALYIGTPALALALAMPFRRALPARTRFGWPAAICLVALLLHRRPTHLLWHAGAEPNGVPDRQAFVLCGLLLIAAWLSTADGLPRPAALAAVLAVLAALALAARGPGSCRWWPSPSW
ncbi:hypothetical protein A8713_03200 [Streptomyces sp. SAT1]|uniref:hypothetical protein n=1 Tax=Streptomyces sp. SAT1 TaxID=1849967 RepID=UPI0007DD087F|nr:hypothetical protein [Streptomyces sp. SAT1]ANH90274.1 hypothetical protein A8713_03200 [Streptomyces sp. SAT1]